MKKLQQKSFMSFLRETGMLPPEMMGKDYDENELLKEEIEARKNPFEDKMDHKEDITRFEISLVNTKNEAFCVNCFV